MTFIPFFHVGFLVDDLEKGMESFGKAFGVTWTVPDIGTVDFWQRAEGEGPLNLVVAYSRQGPPYIELLQSQESGLFNTAQGEGFHHVGMWEPDCEGREAELIKEGITPIATQYTSEREIIVSYFDPDALHGVMLELVDEARKPIMEKWFTGL